jgi:hypothetical protein
MALRKVSISKAWQEESPETEDSNMKLFKLKIEIRISHPEKGLMYLSFTSDQDLGSVTASDLVRYIKQEG